MIRDQAKNKLFEIRKHVRFEQRAEIEKKKNRENVFAYK